MAIRQIVKEGNSILRMECKEVVDFDARLSQLLDDMKETMFKAQGAGIAAPQVGILKSACIVCVDGKNAYELINPKIIKSSGSQCGTEGCLSVPGRSGRVERPKKVVVEAQDRLGNKFTLKANNYLAVACCHEIDHLHGILFTDKIMEETPKKQ